MCFLNQITQKLGSLRSLYSWPDDVLAVFCRCATLPEYYEQNKGCGMAQDLLGAHLSIAGGVHTVFARAAQTGCRTVQIFTKSNKAYFAKPLALEDIATFKAAWQAFDVAQIVTHAAYLINIGASNPEVEKNHGASLRAELERCDQLGIAYLVLHPGSHTGAGMQAGIEKIAQNLNDIFADTPGNCMILLETAAGQKSMSAARLQSYVQFTMRAYRMRNNALVFAWIPVMSLRSAMILPLSKGIRACGKSLMPPLGVICLK